MRRKLARHAYPASEHEAQALGQSGKMRAHDEFEHARRPADAFAVILRRRSEPEAMCRTRATRDRSMDAMLETRE